MHKASEFFAYREARRALDAGDLDESLSSIEIWWRRAAPRGTSIPEEVQGALAELGALRYANNAQPDEGMLRDPRQRAGDALVKARFKITSQASTWNARALPPLNPWTLDQIGSKNV